MKKKPESFRFVTDSATHGNLAGSCGVVGVAVKKAARNLGYRVSETLVPLTDKTSIIHIPDNNQINFIFEELLHRTPLSESAIRLVYFNIHYFSFLRDNETDGISSFESANVTLFNSTYLKNCFEHCFAFSQRRFYRSQIAVLEPASPTSLYPQKGYPTTGPQIDLDDLNNFSKQYLLGHSMRFGKHDIHYTLELMERLNRLAIVNGYKGARLFIPRRSLSNFKSTLNDFRMDPDIEKTLFAVDHLSNVAMREIMSQCHFSLCYDTTIEAFGFYPLESIFEGCPVYSNGVGNLRHLLPANHGLKIADHLSAYFGSKKEQQLAFTHIANSIFKSIISGEGKRDCIAGKRYIEKNYGFKRFTTNLGRILTAANDVPKKKLKDEGVTRTASVAHSPYVKLFDSRKRQYVTDFGPIVASSSSKNYLLKTTLSPSHVVRALDSLDPRLFTVRIVKMNR
jgi:hypothetical protein